MEKYKEADMVFDKSYTCPVCDRVFKSKTLRTGRARALESDMDLRPRYEDIDVLKYDIIACPFCGYAATEKNFPYPTATQRQLVKENISSGFKSREENPDKAVYTYPEALARHKLALVNAIVTRAKDSDKAYICLKTGWLLRGETETLRPQAADYEQKKLENDKAETEFLKSAYDGFLKARASEPFPICGMDSMTLDYLLAALGIILEDYETAKKMISGVLTSKTANPRMKDKAYGLKEILMKRIGEKQEQ